MSVIMGLTQSDGLFFSVAELQAAKVKNNHTVAVNDGTIQWYKVKTTDDGSAVPLDNGLFANPVASNVDPQTATNTAGIATNTTAISKLKGLSPNNQTGTAYTLALSDADDGEVWMNNASANVLTIPTNAVVAFAVGTVILIIMEGVGITSVTADTGVTLNGVTPGSGDLTQFNGVALKKRGTNTWIATPLTVT